MNIFVETVKHTETVQIYKGGNETEKAEIELPI